VGRKITFEVFKSIEPKETTMTPVSEELFSALESDCAQDISQLVRERKREDFEGLQEFLSLDPSVNPQHRAKAIHALGRWGDPAPVPAIRGILPHLDERGRISTVDALGRLGTDEALRGVLEQANDPSPQVRKFVTRALGRINAPEAQAKLREMADADPADFVRALASKSV
jgi:HEAT repeat protein